MFLHCNSTIIICWVMHHPSLGYLFNPLQTYPILLVTLHIALILNTLRALLWPKRVPLFFTVHFDLPRAHSTYKQRTEDSVHFAVHKILLAFSCYDTPYVWSSVSDKEAVSVLSTNLSIYRMIKMIAFLEMSHTVHGLHTVELKCTQSSPLWTSYVCAHWWIC